MSDSLKVDLYKKSKEIFTDYIRLASLLQKDKTTSYILVSGLYEVLKPCIASIGISLGYENFKITDEVLAELERNYFLESPDPYSLIFLQVISLFIQAEDYLETLDTKRLH